MKSTPIVPGGITLMAIGYKYNSKKFLGFIANEGGRGTEPVNPYLSHFPDIYFNVSVLPVVRPHFLGNTYNAINTIENHNRMRQCDLDLDKYWVTQSGYFRLATTVELGMVITDEKLLFCHGISEESVQKNISTRNYNSSMVYECFNNTSTADFGIPDLNLPPSIIADIPHPHKISCYIPDLIPASVSVA